MFKNGWIKGSLLIDEKHKQYSKIGTKLTVELNEHGFQLTSIGKIKHTITKKFLDTYFKNSKTSSWYFFVCFNLFC